jgi:hypothetical protein
MFPVTDDAQQVPKYAGRSVAKVIDNIDPAKEGRIRVFHPFTGDSIWIDYLHLPGQFGVPEIDDLVYIEADAGFIEFPIAWGNLIKEADDTIPESFKRYKPTNRGLFSPLGHLFELDDGTGASGTEKNGVRITTSGGKKLHFNEDTSAQDNKILLEDEDGNKVEIDQVTKKITVTTSSNTILELDGQADSINISTGSGDHLSIANSNIELANSSGSLVINAAGQVELKGSSDGVVALIQELAQTLSTDTYSGFGAPATNVATYADIAVRAQALLAT